MRIQSVKNVHHKVNEEMENARSRKANSHRICVDKLENRFIENKIFQFDIRNKGIYLRKMSINSYIIKVDYIEQEKLAAAVIRVAPIIN